MKVPESGTPEEFKGVDVYYEAHPELDWKKEKSSFYTVELPEVDPYSGYIKSASYPCLYVADELELNKQQYKGIRVLDAHGHIENGVWMAQNTQISEEKVDVIELVRTAFSNGHTVDLLLICSEYALGYDISEPPKNYYDYLNEKGIVYVKPFELIMPRLKLTSSGIVQGYVTGFRHKTKDAFINIENLKR